MPLDAWSDCAWRSSPFRGYRDLLDVFVGSRDWPSLVDLERHWLIARGVSTIDGAPLRLIEQPSKSRRAKSRSRSSLYDVSVSHGAVPTRYRNWHDFFNVMMFAAFVESKRQIHGRHRSILERQLPVSVERLPGARTEEQDCLTILDEGGVLLTTDSCDSATLQALIDSGEHVSLRNMVAAGRVKPWLLGHAHLEHLARGPQANLPRLPSAKAIVLGIGVTAARAAVDSALAARIADPAFCSIRDPRRPVSLGDLFLDLASDGW